MNMQSESFLFLGFIRIYNRESHVCEVDLWLPSPLAAGLRQEGMAAIEYIEVQENCRGKRLGQAALTEASRLIQPYGFHRFMLLTQDHRMDKLAERTGFRRGPTFYWIDSLLGGIEA